MKKLTKKKHLNNDNIVKSFLDTLLSSIRNRDLTVEIYKNKFGLSIIKKDNKYNVAIIFGTKEDYGICNDTPITDDIIENITEEQLISIRGQVEQLPQLPFDAYITELGEGIIPSWRASIEHIN